MTDWRPIADAPLDGTKVDLWLRERKDPRRGHHRLCDYVWCQTHCVWRAAADPHVVNSIPEVFEITHFRVPTAPDEFQHQVAVLKRFDRLVWSTVMRRVLKQQAPRKHNA